MELRWFLTIATVLSPIATRGASAAQGAQPAPAAPAPKAHPWSSATDVAAVLDPVAARDSCIASLVLPFESRLEQPGCTRVTRGIWAFEANHRAAYALQGCLEGEPRLLQAVWDGSRTHEASIASAWTELSKLPAPGTLKFPSASATPRTFGDLLVDPQMPGELGLFKVNHLWSAYLAQYSDFRRLDPARVGDVECARILCDQDGGASAAPAPGYSYPFVLHVDVRKSLVLRADAYTRASGATPATPGDSTWNLELDGRTFVLAQRTEVTKTHEVASNVWIGVEGSVSFRPSRENRRATIRVDIAGVRYNRGVPDALKRIEVVPGAPQGEPASGG